ncbi:ribokinase [Flavihumibacter sp. CACIAM 22H1]|uniref:ribokinase n=1 Tax=Flavihumibacter sp. CACIAM 22H1 TaxID=1812911 RepID=UPI0007A89B26|nr:ribokinase [Flavihumibacter sp. CACIAM 22H1]KYP16597.1 MAG: ribokinase [Flavihumibacter sp. CACIAM 22H1]
MNSKKIVVIGSSNMDMVVKTDHIPVPGETVLSGSFFMNAGGKGANQAVAVARLGGEVVFISKLGNDLFGKQFSQLFNHEGIDTRLIQYDESLPSGVALITVDKAGENSIVVASGANANLHNKDLEGALPAIDGAGILLLQLEIPIDTVSYVAAYAADRRVRVILNPAPAQVLGAELLARIDILTPNKTEAGMLAGIEVSNLETASAAARIICGKGVKNVVVTMGSLGAVICEEGELSVQSVRKVETVDSTAAGDVFNGALAVALAEGKTLKEAVAFACDAASISVTRLGAQSSIPYRNELIASQLELAGA